MKARELAMLVVTIAVVSSAAACNTPDHRGTEQSPPEASTSNTASATSPEATDTPAPRCTADQLGVAVIRDNGALGNPLAELTFRNTSQSMCSLDGYPTLRLGSSPKTVTATDSKPGQFSDQALGIAPVRMAVPLAPGGQATARFAWADTPTSDQTACADPASAWITPPGATKTVRITTGLTNPVCLGLVVDPVQPKTTTPGH
jgi:hypothetical protein